MQKGRWIIGALLIVGVFTVGRKHAEPLWKSLSKDPALGLFIMLVAVVLIWAVVRIVRS